MANEKETKLVTVLRNELIKTRELMERITYLEETYFGVNKHTQALMTTLIGLENGLCKAIDLARKYETGE